MRPTRNLFVLLLVLLGLGGLAVVASRFWGSGLEKPPASPVPPTGSEPSRGSDRGRLDRDPARGATPASVDENTDDESPDADPGAASRLEGRLVDSRTGSPLADLTVILEPIRGGAGARRSPATSASGGFQFDGVPPRAYRLTIDHGFLRIESARQVVEVASGPATDLGDIRVQEGAKLSGRVVDADGRPVEGATVRSSDASIRGWGGGVWPSAGGAGWTGASGSRTDAEGRYNLRAVLPRRPLRVTAEHLDFAPGILEKVSVEAGHERVLEDIRLTTGAAISGRVSNAAGGPVGDASVVIRRDLVAFAGQAPPFPLEERRVKTDGEGRYRAEHLTAGVKSIVVTRKGFSRQTRSGVVIEGTAGEEVSGIDLVLTEGLGIAGRVVGPDARPVPLARVVAHPSSGVQPGDRSRPAPVAEDGSFRLEDLGEGAFDVVAFARGYRQAMKPSVIAGTANLEIALEKSATISGIVVDADTREAVRRARVVAQLSSGDLIAGSTITDDRGRFEITDVVDGSFVLSASADDHAPATTDPLAIAEDEDLKDVVIALPPGATITGLVLAAADRSPISGATVQEAPTDGASPDFFLYPGDPEEGASEERPWFSMGVPRARSGVDGGFSLRGLKAGARVLVASHALYATGRVETATVGRGGLLQGVEILLPVGGSVRGVVYGDDGQPELGAQISLSGAVDIVKSTRTDAEGRYEIRGIPGGRYEVFRYSGELLSGSQETKPVEIRDGETSVVDFGLDRAGCRLFGVVSDGSGPVALASINLFRADSDDGYLGKTVTTDARGLYEAVGLFPGRYHVRVDWGRPVRRRSDVTGFSTSVAVPAAPEYRFDIIAPQGRIAGRVMDAMTGAPLADISVSAWTTEDDSVSANVVSGVDGRYEIPLLGAGEYHVTAEPGGEYAEEPVDGVQVLEGKTTSLDLRLSKGGTLEGSARNSRGERVGPIYGRLLDARGKEVPGTLIFGNAGQDFSRSGLKPGTYVLEIVALGFAAARKGGVRIEAGRVGREDVLLAEGGSLRVIAVDAGGRELASASHAIEDTNGTRPLFPGDFFEGDSDDLPWGVLRHLAPGDYTVRVTVEGLGEGSTSVKIEEGMETVARVTLQ